MDLHLIHRIPLEQIIGGENVRKRYDEEKTAGLSQSPRDSGLREPIHVIRLSSDRFVLLTGGRRLRAARKAGWDTIPAIVEEGEFSKSDTLVLQIIENVQREDLTPMEKANAIDALMKETGWNASQVSAKLGLTNGTVSKLLSFRTLSTELQQQIDSGQLPPTAAYQLTKLQDESEREHLADKVVNGELSRDGLAREVTASKRSRRKRSQRIRPVKFTARIGKQQSVTVSAESLDLNLLVSILENLLQSASQARSEGVDLQGLINRLAATQAGPLPRSVNTD